MSMSKVEHRLLAWDTGFFGFPVHSITGLVSDRQALADTLQALRGQGVRLVYWNCPGNDRKGNEAAASLGGWLADLKLTYARPLAVGKGAVMPATVERLTATSSEDKRLLTELALQSAEHSRFKRDPKMPQDAWCRLFETWMDKSLTGEMADLVLIERHAGRVAGMVTLSHRRPEAQIGLLAVDERHRGRGVAGRLLQAVAHEASAGGCHGVMVVTQGDNAPACHAYEKAGYRRRNLVHTYHFWLIDTP